MRKVVYIAAGPAGVIGTELVVLEAHHTHTTGTGYFSVPASVASGAAFRTMYSEAVETLRDDASQYVHAAPVRDLRQVLERLT